jgi:hypothetical protein
MLRLAQRGLCAVRNTFQYPQNLTGTLEVMETRGQERQIARERRAVNLTARNMEMSRPRVRRYLLLLAWCLLFAPFAAAQSSDLDKYGGAKALKCAKATGWFHTQKIGTRWWLCDPLGNVFFFQSVDFISYISNDSVRYGSIIPAWAEQELLRLEGWGFNGVGYGSYPLLTPGGFDNRFPLDSGGHYSNPIKIPFVIGATPSKYALYNPFGYLTNPVKSMVPVVSPHFVAGGGYPAPGGIPDWYDSSIGAEIASELANDGVQTAYLPYAIGVELDDGDQMNGFGETPDPSFPTDPPGHTLENLAMTVATMSPLQTANSDVYAAGGKGSFVYGNPQMYSKLALENALKTKYTTITALNTSWSSSYTTFDSSGTCVGSQPITCASSTSADMVGTGNGSTITFNKTLSHTTVSEFSLQIVVAGSPVAGEDAHNPGNLWGPNANGTINRSTGALSITFTSGHAPASGAAITATYVANGWGIGTGLLDEADNATSQAWFGTDFVAMSNAKASVRADMNTFLQALAAQYFSTARTQVKAIYPNLMYLGPNSLTAWGTVSPAPVLTAAGQYIDAFVTGNSGRQFSQAQMDYIETYYGDKPYFASNYTCANADSAQSASSACSGGTGSFTTQAARGAAYLTGMQNILQNTHTTAGNFPYIGMEWFAYIDFSGTNWGLVTPSDNAYDGHEALSAVVACSEPISKYKCGGEKANYGNLIGSVVNANTLWLDTARKQAEAGNNAKTKPR